MLPVSVIMHLLKHKERKNKREASHKYNLWPQGEINMGKEHSEHLSCPGRVRVGRNPIFLEMVAQYVLLCDGWERLCDMLWRWQ